MKQENKKPLYKVLNEQRTQGEWNNNLNDGQVLDNGNNPVGNFYGALKMPATLKADAQYTTLAVNNLHHLAEALETLLEFTDKRQVGYKKAKEALNRIS